MGVWKHAHLKQQPIAKSMAWMMNVNSCFFTWGSSQSDVSFPTIMGTPPSHVALTGLRRTDIENQKKHTVDCFDIQKAYISGRANISPLITTVPFHIPCAILTDNRGCPGSFNPLWLGSDVKNKPMWIGNGDSGNVVVRFLVSYFNSKNLRLKPLMGAIWIKRKTTSGHM